MDPVIESASRSLTTDSDSSALNDNQCRHAGRELPLKEFMCRACLVILYLQTAIVESDLKAFGHLAYTCR
jgi:hypothetical protein